LRKKGRQSPIGISEESDGLRGSICEQMPEMSKARGSRDANPAYRVDCEKISGKSNRVKEEKTFFLLFCTEHF